MHAKPLRTIWLVLLTSMTLLASSVASSQILMPFQMLQMSQGSTSDCASDMSMSEMSLTSHHVDNTDPITGCADNDSAQYDCCGTICIPHLATLTSISVDNSPVLVASSYPVEATRKTVRLARSLYRPPNA
ncbi:hypothetical protein [Vibrio panuliri]|uniref:hypothetical protein n=1 Tax=Vibrio panuliri TaxID=1381081 RepID=UPI000951BC83|nr:hypothetical protein [Vibrio panuliri]KAB1454306.1 hypothetical protein F7O85_15590 [Vibrio panuliri]